MRTRQTVYALPLLAVGMTIAIHANALTGYQWRQEPSSGNVAAYSVGAHWYTDIGPLYLWYNGAWQEESSSNWEFVSNDQVTGYPFAITYTGEGPGQVYYGVGGSDEWSFTELYDSNGMVAVAAGEACMSGGSCNTNSDVYGIDGVQNIVQWDVSTSTWSTVIPASYWEDGITPAQIAVNTSQTDCNGHVVYVLGSNGTLYYVNYIWQYETIVPRCIAGAPELAAASLPAFVTVQNISGNVFMGEQGLYQGYSGSYTQLTSDNCYQWPNGNVQPLLGSSGNDIWCWVEDQLAENYALFWYTN
jgi:hypothetical protein